MPASSGTAGAVREIVAIRILPPIVIARFGSSPSPMDNYELRIPVGSDGKPGTGYREIMPAETLVVDEQDGSIKEKSVPAQVRFRDQQDRIRPICPFLEVWVQFAGAAEMVPLTLIDLQALGLGADALRWRARAGNLKPHRRTGDPRDRVEADTGDFSTHEPQPLLGKSPNFKPGKTIPFGHVRYIKPTAAHPAIRARFTPGAGLVFGPRSGDPLTSDDVYAGQTSDGVQYGGMPYGRWDRYYIGNPGSPPVTAPGDIFQGEEIGAGNDRNDWTKLSSGYLDDTCDGILEVALRVGGKTHSAYARFASAVPDFAPDCLPVRSIADDIEQIVLGPDVPPPQTPAEKAELKGDVEDIIRRGMETVRQMNTMVMNGNEPVADVARNSNNMPRQETGYGRAFERVFDGEAEYFATVRRHERQLNRALSASTLETAFPGGMNVMRKPEEVGDLRDDGRRLMPALMRGNEGLELVLTRRQLAKLALAGPAPAPPRTVVPTAAVAQPTKLRIGRLMRPLRSEPPSDEGGR